MKNHFIISYYGNKRDEVEKIYNFLDFTNINKIVEPYCGSSALSFYIASKHPKKFIYELNDNDPYLIALYQIMKDPIKTKLFYEKINNICFTKDDKNNNVFMNKESYNELKKNNNIISWFIQRNYYNIRPGLYPSDRKLLPINRDYPIFDFLRNEKIFFTNMDGIESIKNNNNLETLIFLDPPYLSTNNDFYNNANINVYEWLYNNQRNLLKCYICINDIWINRLLFKDLFFIEYDKIYQTNKRKLKHLLIKINK